MKPIQLSNSHQHGLYIQNPKDPRIVFILRGFDKINLDWIEHDKSISILRDNFRIRRLNVYSPCRKTHKNIKTITTTSLLEESNKQIEFLINHEFNHINLLGISYGGLIALNLGLDYPKHIKHIFLRAPLTDLPTMVEGKYNNLMGPTAFNYFSRVYNEFENFVEDGKKHEIYSKLHNLQIPTFTIHSKKDKLISSIHTQKLIQALQRNKHSKHQFQFLEGRRHNCNPNENYSNQFTQMFNFYNDRI